MTLPEPDKQKIDRLYLLFFLLSLLGGIAGWLRLTNAELGVMNLGLSTFTFISFFIIYLFGKSMILHEYSADRQVLFATMGLIPSVVLGKVLLFLKIEFIAFQGAWIDIFIASMMSLSIVVLEETFRAMIYLSSVYLLRDCSNELSKIVGFMLAVFLWVILHMINHTPDIGYITWLIITGFMLQTVMFSAGLGASILSHYLINILMSL